MGRLDRFFETKNPPTKKAPETVHSFLYNERLRSESYQQHFSRFLRVFCLAAASAYPFRDELILAATRIPRLVQKITDGESPKDVAKKTLETYAEQIASHEPLPVDLFTLYLEQEKVSGGISQETYDQAQEKFTTMILKAKQMQTDGKSRDTILSYLLAQQGIYDGGFALLADLLIEGRGNCEARQRFLSAAYQQLYPEDVAQGKMKTEIFRPGKDSSGRFTPGHVRVVIDEGDGTVSVLEGDHVKTDPASEHENITAQETTRNAVLSFASNEGIHDTPTEEKQDASKPSAIESVSNIFTASDPLNAIDTSIRLAITENGVATYDDAATVYNGGTVTFGNDGESTLTKNVHVKNSRTDWSNAIELTFVGGRTYPELTEAELATVFNRFDGSLDLTRYDVKDPDILKKILTEAQKRRKERAVLLSKKTVSEHDTFFMGVITLRHDQKLPLLKEAWNSPVAFCIDGDGIPEILTRVPVGELFLTDIRSIPSNFSDISFSSSPFISVVFKDAQAQDGMKKDLDPYLVFFLSRMEETFKNGELRFFASERVEPDTDPKLSAYFPYRTFDGITTKKLSLQGIFVENFGTLNAKTIAYDGHTTIYQFSGVRAREAILTFDAQVSDLPLIKPIVSEPMRTNPDIEHINVRGEGYAWEAFSHTTVQTLTTSVNSAIYSDTFRDANIQTLIFENVTPGKAFSECMNSSSEFIPGCGELIGPGIETVIFPFEETVEGISREDTLDIAEKFFRDARSAGVISEKTSVLLIPNADYEALLERYPFAQDIPFSTWVSHDALKGVFVVKK